MTPGDKGWEPTRKYAGWGSNVQRKGKKVTASQNDSLCFFQLRSVKRGLGDVDA